LKVSDFYYGIRVNRQQYFGSHCICDDDVELQMQMRFDGTLGFGGGIVDAADVSIVEGLNRELQEEMNLDLQVHKATQHDHVVSHVCLARKRVTHFYSMQVTIEQYHEIEKRTLLAHEWGREVINFCCHCFV
jgi:U8 snoRNA-decapping enzyme